MPGFARHRSATAGCWLLIVVAGPLVACADREAASSSLASWRVEAMPALAISGDDSLGAPLIGNAEGVTQLPDGGVLVADRGLFALRWFDATGALVRSLGREGKGPDEFEYIARLHRCGDSVFVNEITKAEPWLVYSLDGTMVRDFAFDSPQGVPTYRTTCNATGAFLHMGWERRTGAPPEPGRARGTVPFWLSDATGRATAPLGELPGSERLVTLRGSRPHPLGREPLLALGRTRAYVATADSFTIRTFGLDGAPLASIIDEPGDLGTTDDDIARYKYRDTLGVTDARKANAEREWATFTFPPTVPAYDAMLVDVLDHLWVRRTPRAIGAPARWHVFDPDGTRVAVVNLPDALEVHEIGTDYILGIRLDASSGAQVVERYSLQRAANATDAGRTR